MKQIYQNYFIPHYDNEPVCLQHKVYFDIAFYLGKRGTEGLHDMKKNSFGFFTTDDKKEYLQLTYNECTKKAQGDNYNESNEEPILLAQPGDPRCPVNSFKLYLSKLSSIDDLFQTPNPCFKIPNDIWYKATPCGVNTIGNFMKQISQRSGPLHIYTNHCVRGTTATAIKCAGHDLPEIAKVTHHQNLESLKYCLEKLTLEDKQKHSNDLFKYTTSDINDNSDMTCLTPPPPCKRKTSKATATVSKNAETQLVAVSPNDNHQVQNSDLPLQNMSQSTQNILQIYRQNPIWMFVGANISNCTININFPK